MARGKKKIEDNKPVWAGVNATNIAEIKECLEQTDTFMAEMDDTRENLKECFVALNDKYGMPKSLFNKLVKMHYKQNGEEEIEKNDEFSEAWNKLYSND